MKNKTLLILYSALSFPFFLLGLFNYGKELDISMHDTYIVVDTMPFFFFFGVFGLIHLVIYGLLRSRQTLKLLDRIILFVHLTSLFLIVYAIYGILSITLENYRSNFQIYDYLFMTGFIGLIGNLFLQIPNALFSKRKKI